MTGIGIVGCGFVADYYLACLRNYKNLDIVGVYDKDEKRLKAFSEHHNLLSAKGFDQLLNNPKIDIILNLTNPRNHYTITKSALEAGKHVYSEKPLAMEMDQALELYNISKANQKYLAVAPCNILGESAQTLWKAVREGMVGDVRLVYAELDDGPIYLMNPEKWRSSSGAPWPIKDEYEVGCTFEHAGYYLTWLVTFFGSAESVTVTKHQLIQDKLKTEPLEPSDTPDFSVACIKFASGTVARLTCSITAPHNHSLQIIGDKGVLSVDECWHFANPVKYMPFTSLSFRAVQYEFIRNNSFFRWAFGLSPKKIPFVKQPGFSKRFVRNYMDYARGVSELASAVREKRDCRLSSELALHVNEIICAIYSAEDYSGFHTLKTTCQQMAPMDWAN